MQKFFCYDDKCIVVVYKFIFFFLIVVGLDSRSKTSADDGFVTVSLKPDKGITLPSVLVTSLLVGHWFLGP